MAAGDDEETEVVDPVVARVLELARVHLAGRCETFATDASIEWTGGRWLRVCRLGEREMRLVARKRGEPPRFLDLEGSSAAELVAFLAWLDGRGPRALAGRALDPDDYA